MIIHMNGGGASLNFAVKAYPTEEALNAATPKENTIGVIADYITGWTFGAEQPETTEAGAVWISTGDTSPVKFNALKKNALMVYPGSVMYHNGTEWKNVDAYIYQKGAWVKFSLAWDGYYFKDGNQYEYITGGWTTEGWNNQATANTDNGILYVESPNAQYAARIGTEKPVDLTGVDKIWLDSPSGQGSSAYSGYLLVCTDKEDYTDVKQAQITTGTVSVDVSGLSGPHYLLLRTLGGTNGSGSASVRAIWKEGAATPSESGIALLSLDNTPGDDVVNAIVDDVGYGVTNATINEEPTRETYDFTVL